jgi:hypothetical protein
MGVLDEEQNPSRAGKRQQGIGNQTKGQPLITKIFWKQRSCDEGINLTFPHLHQQPSNLFGRSVSKALSNGRLFR